MSQRARQIRAEQDAIREILNAWDPIAPGYCPADEYDCLVDHIVSQLHRGAIEDHLREFIVSEFASHFGITVSVAEVDRVTQQIMAWWALNRSG